MTDYLLIWRTCSHHYKKKNEW